MEVSKDVNVTCGGDSFKLTKQVSEKNMAAYFTMYDTSRPHTICLVSSLQCPQTKIINQVLARIKSCKELFGADSSLNYKKVDEITQIQTQDRKQIVLVYNGINPINNLSSMKGKMKESEILELAIFLLHIVIKIKENNAYFGSFHPTRIFQMAQLGYCFMGGELFTKKCNTTDFLAANNDLQPLLVNSWKYQPPQLYDQASLSILSYSSDLFVVSCILCEMMTGQYPFATPQSLINRETSASKSSSSILQQICKKVLQPSASQRVQPEQLMRLVELERGRAMFNTRGLEIPMGQLTAAKKPWLFDNFQEFIMKCTTETEGWFLYFCENSEQRPDEKYLDQVLAKINKKSEKINKLIGLIEKCSSKQIKETNINYDQDNSYSTLKMGLFILHMLRRLPTDMMEPYYNSLSKVCSKIITKNAQNKIIIILFKIIAFKISLSSKFAYFSGNFHLTPQDYMKTTPESLEYVCQYCLKMLTYFSKLIDDHTFDKLVQCENAGLLLLCDQLYNATSTVLYCLISMKKDCALKIAQRESMSPLAFKKLDSLCLQMVRQINKLSNSQSLFGCHQLYSVSADYYEYQQQLCLMYCPILTSYEYFYIDRNQYKGLAIPKNYHTVNDEFEQQDQKYLNRKPMMNRLSSIKASNDQQFRMNSGSNSQNAKNSTDIAASMKSEGGPSNKGTPVTVQIQPKTEKKISPAQQKQIDQFKAFLTNINSTPKDQSSSASNAATLATNTASSAIEKSNESNHSLSWMDPNEHDILSYEYLKKTEKMAPQIFEKPEIDAAIYKVYDDICKGLKLHELIETISKNKKVIVDPNQVLFQKVIGSGSAGDVYIGKYKENVVAIKKVKLASNPNALKEFQREVLTYIKIKSHPNLVSLVGLTKFSQDYFLLTQFCEGGSLFDLLHKRANQILLTWKQRLSIALDIAKGMQVLHFMNPPVIHRDMKSLNVFMTFRNNQWVGKVADFGLSRTPDADMMTSALGTLHWMAPELLSNKQYSLKVDVYSFAVVLWEICSRRTPYHNIPNQMGIVKHVVLEKGRPLLDLIPSDCPKQLVSLIKKCWSESPQDRPYFSEIVTELNSLKF